jgi:hypothetical protein
LKSLQMQEKIANEIKERKDKTVDWNDLWKKGTKKWQSREIYFVIFISSFLLSFFWFHHHIVYYQDNLRNL